MNAAAKSLSTTICPTTAYRIRGRLGGKSSPIDPLVVTRPTEKRSGYSASNKAGNSRPPIAMIVIPLPPVNVVKNAEVTRHTNAKPPGSQPKNARGKLNQAMPACRFWRADNPQT